MDRVEIVGHREPRKVLRFQVPLNCRLMPPLYRINRLSVNTKYNLSDSLFPMTETSMNSEADILPEISQEIPHTPARLGNTG